ncbi:MAG TPA: DUF5995 family protein [Gillisia sp.]|nr:DUF5995 family protein [Gillisia sp.]
MKELNSTDDVIKVLDDIIQVSEQSNDPRGYFAVIYRRVTWKVKEGIETGYFDDAARMEKLDIVFAKRYFDAYYDYEAYGRATASWETAFLYSRKYWPVIIQHLLIGMNAHINLDLGIAAAEVSKNKNIEELRDDFYRINYILASLVDEVQDNLSTIWKPLRPILKKMGKYDNMVVDFSMELARDGAWEFAKELATKKESEKEDFIALRDQTIVKKAALVTNPGMVGNILLGLVRLGERGTVSEKLEKLKYVSDERPVESILSP